MRGGRRHDITRRSVRQGALYAALLSTSSLAAVDAQAALVISTDTTANVSCSSGVCTATAENAVLNVSTLVNMLASSDVQVVSGSKAANIVIDTAISTPFLGPHNLTFDAYRSLRFNKPLTIQGPGALSLLINDGDVGGTLSFGRQANVHFLATSNTLRINGVPYSLVDSVASLASAIAADPAGFYALANNYDARPDGTYAQAPVSANFTGNLEGLGNTIAHLSINDTTAGDNVGLFGFLGQPGRGSVENLRFTTAHVVGGRLTETGILAGASVGTVSGVTVSGKVEVGPESYVGGLIGINDGNVVNSMSAASVHGAHRTIVGGLAGISGIGGMGSIQSCSATGAVSSSGASKEGSFIGGLVAYNEGAITNSYATGSVSSAFNVYAGGLVGAAGHYGRITNSYATGAVTGGPNSTLGGLASFGWGVIADTYAKGSVTGGSGSLIGGLVGRNGTEVIQHHSYSEKISASYSTGAVTGGAGSSIGGLIGEDQAPAGFLTNVYWDTTTSGITNLSQGAGNVSDDPGITGLSTTQLQSGLPTGFDTRIWAESAGINGGLPYLRFLPPN